MKQQDISPLAEASAKFSVNSVNFHLDLPMLEIILQTKAKSDCFLGVPMRDSGTTDISPTFATRGVIHEFFEAATRVS